MNIASIVEGHGEVAALPVLLRRLNEWQTPDKLVQVLMPIRVHRDRCILREGEFQRLLAQAAPNCGDAGGILILLDADDDCPAKLGTTLLQRARECVPQRRISVVLANREYESWFIAAAQSLDGHRGFTCDLNKRTDAETPRNAKGWIRECMATGIYSETTDQPAFSAHIDLQQTFDGSRSFRKLCTEWRKQQGVID